MCGKVSDLTWILIDTLINMSMRIFSLIIYLMTDRPNNLDLMNDLDGVKVWYSLFFKNLAHYSPH